MNSENSVEASLSQELAAKLTKLRENLNAVIRGKQDVIELLIIALIAGEAVLIEDVPGVGKTTLAKSLSASLGLEFRRVQCTPDLMPSDIFGFSVFKPQDGTFEFRKGPIFTHVLLVDEINRASPRTQSALLEAMAEKQVTVEGQHFELEAPFLVLATQNPLGFQGTFALPEAQLDRFLFQLTLEYPDTESEIEILFDQVSAEPVSIAERVLTRQEVLDCQKSAQAVTFERCVANYIVEIVQQTRHDRRLRLGGSPRATLMLCRAAQACAFVNDRRFITPDDVQLVAPFVLGHRVVAHDSQMTAAAKSEIINDVVRQVEIPL